MKIRYLYITCLILLSVRLLSQSNIEAKATADTSHYLFGDEVKIYLEVSPVSRNANVSDAVDILDSISAADDDARLGNVEVLDRSPWSFDNGIMSSQLVLGAYDTGYQFYICPIIVSQDSGVDTVLSQAAFFYIEPVPTDSTGIAPIKDIIEEQLTFEDFKSVIFILLGIIILGVLPIGFLIYWFHYRKKKRRPKVEHTVYIPPYEVAYAKLRDLKEEALWQKGEIKTYQSKLTYILREYIENAVGTKALELTTSETINELRAKNFDENQLKELANMLNIADLVKFAKGQPDVNIHVELMEKAHDFLDVTERLNKMSKANEEE